MTLQRIELDNKSMTFLLNWILENINKDRELAISHHKELNGLLTEIGSSLGGDVEQLPFLLQNASNGLRDFLNTALKSTEAAIKLAKLLSDHVLSMSGEGDIDEDDREKIEKLVDKMQKEKEEIGHDLRIVGGNDGT